MSDARNPRQLKYPGINEVADKLKVDRTHLWHVLEGQRESRSLLERVRRLNLNCELNQY